MDELLVKIILLIPCVISFLILCFLLIMLLMGRTSKVIQKPDEENPNIYFDSVSVDSVPNVQTMSDMSVSSYSQLGFEDPDECPENNPNLEVFASIKYEKHDLSEYIDKSSTYDLSLNLESYNETEKRLLNAVKSCDNKLDEQLAEIEKDYSLYSTDLQPTQEFTPMELASAADDLFESGKSYFKSQANEISISFSNSIQ